MSPILKLWSMALTVSLLPGDQDTELSVPSLVSCWVVSCFDSCHDDKGLNL